MSSRVDRSLPEAEILTNSKAEPLPKALSLNVMGVNKRVAFLNTLGGQASQALFDQSPPQSAAAIFASHRQMIQESAASVVSAEKRGNDFFSLTSHPAQPRISSQEAVQGRQRI